jgi:hypothetical protein
LSVGVSSVSASAAMRISRRSVLMCFEGKRTGGSLKHALVMPLVQIRLLVYLDALAFDVDKPDFGNVEPRAKRHFNAAVILIVGPAPSTRSNTSSGSGCIVE